jgi:hypothetical protein
MNALGIPKIKHDPMKNSLTTTPRKNWKSPTLKFSCGEK